MLSYNIPIVPFEEASDHQYGDQIGRTIDFPTINVALKRLTPCLHGIYVAEVQTIYEPSLPERVAQQNHGQLLSLGSGGLLDPQKDAWARVERRQSQNTLPTVNAIFKHVLGLVHVKASHSRGLSAAAE